MQVSKVAQEFYVCVCHILQSRDAVYIAWEIFCPRREFLGTTYFSPVQKIWNDEIKSKNENFFIELQV
jgi:hypothetical protein